MIVVNGYHVKMQWMFLVQHCNVQNQVVHKILVNQIHDVVAMRIVAKRIHKSFGHPSYMISIYTWIIFKNRSGDGVPSLEARLLPLSVRDAGGLTPLGGRPLAVI